MLLLLQGSLAFASQEGSGGGSSEKPTKLPTMPKTKVEPPDIPPFDPSTLESVSPPLEAITLVPGWNFVSIPEQPDDPSAASVLAPIAGKYFKVWAVDNCDTEDPWKLYQPSDLASSDLETIDPTKGMWIKALEVVDLPSTGTMAQKTSIHLCPGWNLIGFPLPQIRTMPEAMRPFEGKYRRVMSYDATATESQWDVYSTDVPEWGNDLWEMKPGRAYWVLATEEVTAEFINEGPPPEVELFTPDDLTIVTEPIEVLGAVHSPFLDHWTLRYRPAGEEEWTDWATGDRTTDVYNLAYFDPTLLLNGLYEIQLTAVDWAGQTAESEIRSVSVEGNMKIGNFTLSFVDLSVPVSGLDLEIVRTYDSRDKLKRDFGVGWTLDIHQGSYRNNRAPGDGWQLTEGFLPCDSSLESKPHVTTIRLSDHEIYRFALRLVDGLSSTGGGCYAHAEFEYIDGPTPGAALEILGNIRVFQETQSSDRVLDLDTLDTFEPQNVRLTTRDGRIFDLDLDIGVTRIEDPNGNQLEITDQGILHSAGLTITFERDAEGRITQITDLAGETFEYRYNPDGDLYLIQDQAGRTAQYYYREGHHLEKIWTSDGKILLTVDYDVDDRLTRHCNALLECFEIERDLEKQIERRTDPTGRTVEYLYDSRGNVVSTTDGLGNTYQFEHDAKDRLTALVDPTGARTTWVYNAFGDLLKHVEPHETGEDPADYTTSMTYDDRGSLLTVTRPGGATWSYGRDPAGNLMHLRDGDGQERYFARYDARGTLITEGNRFGEIHYLDLQSFGEPSRITDTLGGEILVEYDNAGRVTRLEEGSAVSVLEYNAAGDEIRANYGEGFLHETKYDGLGRWTTQQNPFFGKLERRLDGAGRPAGWSYAESSVSYTRDAAGRLLETVDPAGRRTALEYDAAGRVVRKVEPGGAETRLELDAAGRIVAATDALDHRTELTYHPSGRLKTLRDPLGREWTFSHGPTYKETKDPLDRTTRIEVGAEGELTKQIHADGTVSTIEYVADAPYGERADYPIRFIDEAGEIRSLAYDAFGRLASAGDPSARVWSYRNTVDTFDAMAPSGRKILSETFDVDGNLIRRGYGDGNEIQWTYGSAPDPSGILMPSGAHADLTYDATGRLISQKTSTGESKTFAWNPVGQLQSHQDPTGNTGYTYDARGSLAALEHADGTRIQYERDLLGRVIELKVREPGSTSFHTTSYGYDEAGNPISVTSPTGGITTFTYDAAHRLVGQNRPNGIETEISYDLRDRITTILHRRADGTVLASFDYQRGLRGEPLRITREDGTAIEYDYDAALRITAQRRLDAADTVVDETLWEYDFDGRRSAVTQNGRRLEYDYLPGNRLSRVREGEQVVESYQWDVDGRLVSITRDGQTLELAYDFEDQLLSVTATAGEIVYAYDATGRKIQATEGEEIRRYAVAPGSDETMDLVHGVHGSTEGWSGYVWAGSLPLARYRGENIEHYLTDAQGSVISIVDADGQEIESFDYDAFGEDQSAPSSSEHIRAAGGAIRFQGQWLDTRSSLYHFRARVYDPATGRFLTRDPVDPDPANPETLDPYQFASSNPLLFTDPLGLMNMPEVNIASLVQNMIGSIKSLAVNMIKERIRQRIGNAASNLFMSWLEGVIGVESPDFRFPKGLPFWRLGNLLEEVVQDIICRVVPQGRDLAYFEPKIDQSDGRAVDERAGNGYTCSERPGSRSKAKKGERYPDILMRSLPPKGPPRYGTLVVSEVKLSASTFYNSWLRGGRRSRLGQWRAIWKHGLTYSYPPRALLLFSLRPGPRGVHERLRKEWRSKGLYGRLVTLL